MPKWIHDRAEHLLAKNPEMSKSMAFAIATQQAHGRSGEKTANVKEPETTNKSQLGLGSAALAAPFAASVTAAEAAPRLVGSELLYHGTGASAAQNAKQHGLDPALGGKGAATWEHASPDYAQNSKGKVHVSKSRTNAEMYARLGGDLEVGKHTNPIDLTMGRGTGKGAVLPISLPFDRVKSDFQLDPDGDLLNDLRTSKTVPASAIGDPSEAYLKSVWRGRPSNYLAYVKNNPKRVAAGAALAAATPALLYGGYRAGKRLLTGSADEKTAALGAAPLWRSQAGFTPPGMATAAQRLKKSMNIGVVDPNKGLKPLNIKVARFFERDGRLHHEFAPGISFSLPAGSPEATAYRARYEAKTPEAPKAPIPKSSKPAKQASVGVVVAEITKHAGLMGAVRALPGTVKGLATGSTDKLTHLNEVAGLGVLAVPGLDTMQSRIRARLAGDKSHDAAEKRQFLGEGAHAALDVGGLAMLAGPSLAHLRKHAFTYSSYGGQAAQNPPGMKGRSQIPGFSAPELEVKVAKHAPLHRLGELVTGSRAGKLYDAALRHADDASAGGGHRAHKASRKLRALARREEGNVGKVQGALAASAALGAISDATGFAEKARSKEAGVLSRAGELITGSRARRLSQAADKHLSAAKSAIQGVHNSDLVRAAKDRAIASPTAKNVAHARRLIGKGVGTAKREANAARKIDQLAFKERGNVINTRLGLTGAGFAAAMAATPKHKYGPKPRKKEAGVGVGAGMSTSQYSGPLSYGPFKMTSGIPPFRSPAMTKHEPAADPAEWMVGGDKQASQRLYRELDAGNVTLSELPSGLRETIAPSRDPNYNTALNKWQGRASLRTNPGVDGMTYSGADPHDIKMRGIRGKIMDKKELLGAPKASGSALRKGLLVGVPAALGVAALAAGAHHLAKNKTAASMNTATGGMSPAARLSTTQRVGAPKTTGFSGPSIADISKPKGFGTPLPGAQKNQL